MTSQNSDAPDLAGSWGAGNVIPLDLHPNFTTHHQDRNQAAFTTTPAIDPTVDLRAVIELVRAVDRRLVGQPIPVRLFVGNDAIRRARDWDGRHGHGSALAMPDWLDPAIVPWPPVHALAVIPCEHPLPYHVAAGVAAALRRDGVGYAAIPHQPDWPNLWPANRHGGDV